MRITLLAYDGANRRARRGGPPSPATPKTRNPSFWPPRAPKGPGRPLGRPRGPYGLIQTRTSPCGPTKPPLMAILRIFVGHLLSIFGNICQTNPTSTKNSCFNESHICSPYNSVQDALSAKLWGPSFDDFVDITILMILGSWGLAY